jgi:hypothetical protein
MSVTGPTRTVGQLFRDCLRLVNHVSGKSVKGANLRRIVGEEFRKNAKVKDPEHVDRLKGNAIRALSNYLMLTSLSKDNKFKEKAGAYNERTLKGVAAEEQAEQKMEQEYKTALRERDTQG